VDTSRFDVASVAPARLLASGGALVLLVSLFLEWYSGNGYSQSGWDAFDGDKLIALFAVAALAVIGLDAFGIEAGLPADTGRLLALLGGLSLFIVVLRLIDLSHRGNGLYLALLASAAVTAGGLRESRDGARSRPG
jgi:hypothetical protein